MRIDYLREFAVFAGQLNFTTAAEMLYITQPALSNHISAIEKDVGFKLVERSRGNSSRLTKAGRLFLPKVNKILEIYDMAIMEGRNAEKETIGSLVIQMPVDMHTGTRTLLDLINKFSDIYPNIEIIHKNNSTYGLTSETIRTDVDLGLTRTLFNGAYINANTEDLGYIPLSHEEACAWIDSRNPLAERETLTPKDLEELTYPYMTPYHHTTWKNLFDGIENHFDISLNVHPVFVGVREEFYLGSFSITDCIFLSESLHNDLMFSYRSDRVWKKFNPPLYLAHWIVYNAKANNPALDLFLNFAKEHRPNQEEIPWVSESIHLDDQ